MTTPNLDLPEWAQNQNQPHVPHNAALRILDCFAQLVVLDRDLTSPPGSPSEGDVYIPASGSTGDWANHENDITMYIGGAWTFRTPQVGWSAYVLDEDLDIRYYGTSPPSWEIIV